MAAAASYWRRIVVVATVFAVGILMIAFYTGDSSPELSTVASERSNDSLSLPHRRLLRRAEVHPERIWGEWGEKCSKTDIAVNQGATDPLPSGIPTYTVEITNVCSTGCNISGIHLSCGWFSSARLINPLIFKRIKYDDCLVNNGEPLANGGTLSFQYANTFHYPLAVSNVVC